MCQDRHVPGENYYSETAKTRGAAELQQAEAQSEHLDEQLWASTREAACLR